MFLGKDGWIRGSSPRMTQSTLRRSSIISSPPADMAAEMEFVHGKETSACSSPRNPAAIPVLKSAPRLDVRRWRNALRLLRPTSYCQCVIDFDAEIPDRAFDLAMTEQELN